jgi:hypothetical protein
MTTTFAVAFEPANESASARVQDSDAAYVAA